MRRYFENLANALLGQSYKDLDTQEQKIIESIAESTPIAENSNNSYAETLSFGQRLADAVANFGGSWTFIGLFFAFIAAWISINTLWLVGEDVFDPFPFILLNLGLSTLAAFQAPIIMMSQNRQAAKDRIKQDLAYEVNLKIELEIMRLHQRLDDMNKKDTPSS